MSEYDAKKECYFCKKKFPRWHAVSVKDARYVFHVDSLQWHFIITKECNDKQAEMIKENRIARQEQEYADMMDNL